MQVIEIAKIVIAANRHRKTFAEDKLRKLVESIESASLLHPIILRSTDGVFTLVAGERRLRAVTDIWGLGGTFKHDGSLVPTGTIPYVDLRDLTPLAAEEAEYEENESRTDLSWQERALVINRLLSLRTRQAEASGTAMPTTATIALEIRGSDEGAYHEATRRELVVGRNLAIPEVAAAKTVDEAFKILKKLDASAKHRELGALVGRTFTASVHSAVHGNSLDWMRNCAHDQFDCILTDSPYGMGADEFGDSGGLAAGAHGYADTPELAARCYSALAVEGFRITKTQAHLYAFCDIDSFLVLKLVFAAAGWQVFRTPLIWYKPTAMRAPWPELGPQRKYETILYAVKGKRPVLKMAGDVLNYAPDSNLGHTAQKPVALFADLLSRTLLPGQSVLDPFMGSGTIFTAANGLKIRATGVELDQASYGIAVARLEGLKAAAELDTTLGL